MEQEQYYVVLARTRPLTSRNLKSNKFIEITLQGIDTGHRYKTYVDPSFRNYKFWADVIGLLDAGRASIVNFSKLKFTDADHTTIDADCRPTFYKSGNIDELTAECDAVQVSRTQPQPKQVLTKSKITREDLFQDLFEVVR